MAACSLRSGAVGWIRIAKGGTVMKAYEFSTTITAEGEIALPAALSELLPHDQQIRVIVLVPEPASYDTNLTPEEENRAWAQFGAQQLARFYGEADEIYDRL